MRSKWQINTSFQGMINPMSLYSITISLVIQIYRWNCYQTELSNACVTRSSLFRRNSLHYYCLEIKFLHALLILNSLDLLSLQTNTTLFIRSENMIRKNEEKKNDGENCRWTCRNSHMFTLNVKCMLWKIQWRIYTYMYTVHYTVPICRIICEVCILQLKKETHRTMTQTTKYRNMKM